MRKLIKKATAFVATAAIATAMCMTAMAADVYSVIGTVNGNWDTDSDMTDEGNGVYSVTLDVAAGSYEWKVRADHDWEDSWGAVKDDGTTYAGMDNCALELAQDSKVKFTLDTSSGAEGVLTWPATATVLEDAATDDTTTDDTTTDDTTADDTTADDTTADDTTADDTTADDTTADDTTVDNQAPQTGDATPFAAAAVAVVAMGAAVVALNAKKVR